MLHNIRTASSKGMTELLIELKVLTATSSKQVSGTLEIFLATCIII